MTQQQENKLRYRLYWWCFNWFTHLLLEVGRWPRVAKLKGHLSGRLQRLDEGWSRHYITSHHITSHHITSHHITSHHITSHHITSHHITSHHITLHYTQLYTFPEGALCILVLMWTDLKRNWAHKTTISRLEFSLIWGPVGPTQLDICGPDSKCAPPPAKLNPAFYALC